jgi:Aromatic amino acid lyase
LCCAPQVTGAVRDTLAHARTVAGREIEAAIDNPVVLPTGEVSPNGNFHGAPVGYVLDFLAIAVADLGSIAERRTDRLLDQARSHGLPPFLAANPGVDSGLMIAQYTQAAMVSENKRLAVPASVDSIPKSGMPEDHVSMGWSAARKLRTALANLRRILAIELVVAARATELRAPLEPAASSATAAIHQLFHHRLTGGTGPFPGGRYLAWYLGDPAFQTVADRRFRLNGVTYVSVDFAGPLTDLRRQILDSLAELAAGSSAPIRSLALPGGVADGDEQRQVALAARRTVRCLHRVWRSGRGGDLAQFAAADGRPGLGAALGRSGWGRP